MASSRSVQKSAKGFVGISEVDPDGKFICLENTHRGRDEDMSEWKLKRIVDNKREVIFCFPNPFILPGGTTVKIWASDQGGQNNPPHELILNETDNWGTGQSLQTLLYGKHGEEKATFIKRLH